MTVMVMLLLALKRFFSYLWADLQLVCMRRKMVEQATAFQEWRYGH